MDRERDIDLLAKMGTDAAIWAAAYEERFPDKTPDWGTLVGWFANAIEAGRTAGREAQEYEPNSS